MSAKWPDPINAEAEKRLRAELARGRQALASIGPVLSHLVADTTPTLFSEEAIARTRGVVESIARQLLRRINDEELRVHEGPLVTALLGQSALLAHCHVITLEYALTTRLSSGALDPVLSPQLQSAIAGQDKERAALAMNVLAAQTRFMQSLRRMEAMIEELPSELVRDALIPLEHMVGEPAEALAHSLLECLDESRSRAGLITRFLLSGDGYLAESLEPGSGGVALFLSALSLSTGVPRSSVILATADGQQARLALMLGACGVRPERREAILSLLLPDAGLPLEAMAAEPGHSRELLAEEGMR